ncbi:metal ABC transporter solute-binding protein, Zn/Mn family [Rossellomorea sp. YZS02]|uniref:metal ABC transporter solute-binding protein, Zn/Mn family n=1 Tax=Rossellomorea sp. YZS02 TaxID=3097358 RepID=UPI002A154F62|nr:zinc ABC transporter substrate-binding protein [Rossellomorea sp. YZS02]MDX8345032.1 zinc ABC transporter substrate-binding protein [Rossellomorea sp. YZS02]
MKKYLFISLVLILSMFLSACNQTNKTTGNNGSQSEGGESISIMTSLYPLQYFAERIGGDLVKVESLLPPGSDAHTFEPTSKDMISIAESDLFIFNGLGMESYAEKITKSLENEDTIMVEATKGVDVIASSHDHSEEGHHDEGEAAHEEDHHEEGDAAHEEEHHEEGDAAHEEEHHEEGDATHEEEHHEEDAAVHEEEHHHGDYDPHVWLDPNRAIGLAENIRDALIDLQPQHKDSFNQNFDELKKDLESIDTEFTSLAQESDHPEILVSHAAYGYWEDAYGIEQLAVAGLSPTDEPSQKELKEIIETAKEHSIHYVIFEQNVTTRVAEIIQKEINAKPLKVHNLSVLTESDIENNENYLTLMKKNIKILEQAMND